MIEGDLQRNGFCHLPQALPKETVRSLLGVFGNAFVDDTESVRARSSRGHVYAARNLIDSIPEVKSIWQVDPVLTLLREVLGDGCGLVRALFFDKTP